MIAKYGEFVEDRRLYVINEVCTQVIGAGDMTVTFFVADPTHYPPNQVTIWEGKFRNFAKVSKSTRAWTTTIRFGQPNIQTIIQYKDDEGNVVREEIKDALYRYPRTILADIQKRPHLPPPPIEHPGELHTYTMATYAYQEWDVKLNIEIPLIEGLSNTEDYWTAREKQKQAFNISDSFFGLNNKERKAPPEKSVHDEIVESLAKDGIPKRHYHD